MTNASIVFRIISVVAYYSYCPANLLLFCHTTKEKDKKKSPDLTGDSFLFYQTVIFSLLPRWACT